MTVIAVSSSRSSPGATSLAVALGFAWRASGEQPLIVEADEAGGVLGLRFGLPHERTWTTLSADLRRANRPGLVVENAVDLNGLPCVLAPVDPVMSAAALRRSAATVAELLASMDGPVVVDLGRTDGHEAALPLARAADEVLLVCRPRPDEVQSALFAIRLLEANDCRPALVIVGDQPHSPQEVADLAGIRLAAVIPDDPALAVAFSGGRFAAGRLRRSTLWRSVAALADDLASRQPLAAQFAMAADIEVGQQPSSDVAQPPPPGPPAELPVAPPPPIAEVNGWPQPAGGVVLAGRRTAPGHATVDQTVAHQPAMDPTAGDETAPDLAAFEHLADHQPPKGHLADHQPLDHQPPKGHLADHQPLDHERPSDQPPDDQSAGQLPDGRLSEETSVLDHPADERSAVDGPPKPRPPVPPRRTSSGPDGVRSSWRSNRGDGGGGR